MTQEAATLPMCEVIIFTALPVECQAVLHFLQEPREIVHPSGTVYHQGTFLGTQRTWRVAVVEIGMGGVAAALEAEKAITFLHAQLALFVGIAGGLKDVRRGDVVAATKVYRYESGKAGPRFEPRPELDHSSHALEQRARAEAHHEGWLAHLASACPDPVPQVFIGALAAGEKVLASRQSSLARLLKRTYGDTLAVEMESHGFLHAVRLNHGVHGLVIRGISDLIDDKTTADAAGWQQVAALHAAAFAFQILATFALPESPSSAPVSPTHASVWHMPFARNPFFTGREDLLARLHAQLRTMGVAEVSQPQAISGLGGIGKTQLMLEYAYRARQEYQAVLWARADSTEALNASYTEMARVLQLPQHDTQEQEVIVQAVKHWFSRNQGWLLVLDNADDLALVQAFLPPSGQGHLVLTTRTHTTGKLARRFDVDTLDGEEGALLLLRRAGLVLPDASVETALSSNRALANVLARELGGLPLALDQAGAYIEETGCSLASYHQQYQTRRAELLALRGGLNDDHPEPVMTIWSLSFAKVEAANPLAAQMLRFCAFLAPDAIPEALIMKALDLGVLSTEQEASDGEGSFSPIMLGPQRESIPQRDQQGKMDTIGAIQRAYSLVQRNPQEATLGVHQLIREAMEEAERQTWVRRTVQVVKEALPEITFAQWRQCEQYVPHAQVCAQEKGETNGEEEAQVWDWVGAYLLERQRTQEAGPYVQQALSLRERVLGNEHLKTAASPGRVARWWHLQGKDTQAEPLVVRALAIRERELGPNHPHTQIVRANVTTLRAMMQSDESASC